jgi:hypothetical protein
MQLDMKVIVMNCGGVVQKSCDINKLREVAAGYPGATYIVVRSIEVGGQQIWRRTESLRSDGKCAWREIGEGTAGYTDANDTYVRRAFEGFLSRRQHVILFVFFTLLVVLVPIGALPPTI